MVSCFYPSQPIGRKQSSIFFPVSYCSEIATGWAFLPAISQTASRGGCYLKKTRSWPGCPGPGHLPLCLCLSLFTWAWQQGFLLALQGPACTHVSGACISPVVSAHRGLGRDGTGMQVASRLLGLLGSSFSLLSRVLLFFPNRV